MTAQHEEEESQQSGPSPGHVKTRVLATTAAAGLAAVATAGLLELDQGLAHPGGGHASPGSAATPTTGPSQAAGSPAAQTPGPPQAARGSAAYQADTADQVGAVAPRQAGGGQAGISPEAAQPQQAGAPLWHAPAHLRAASPARAPLAGTPTIPTAPKPLPGTLAPATASAVLAGSGAIAAAGSAPSRVHTAGQPGTGTAGTAAASALPSAVAMPLAAGTARQQEPAGPWSVLFDQAGTPAGMVNAAGAFSAFPGTAAASASAAAPLALFDAAGHEVGAYGGASRLRPPLAVGQSPRLAGVPAARTGTHGQTPGGVPAASTPAPAGQQQTVTQVVYTSGPPVPMSDAQVNQMMLDSSPAQREDLIRQFLERALTDPQTKPGEKPAIQQILDGGIPNLPDSFWAHGSYTYQDDKGKVTLNTLQAAANVAMLEESFSHFQVYIQDLSDTAGKLYAKGDDISIPAMSVGFRLQAVDKMWDTLFADAGSSSDPNVLAAQGTFTQVKNALVGNLPADPKTMIRRHSQGNIPITAQAIRDKADALHEIAAMYVHEEQTNLSWFDIQASDPRPAWEKARFTVTKVNGRPTPVDNAATGKYPPGYFDPNNPGSPYYNGRGPDS